MKILCIKMPVSALLIAIGLAGQSQDTEDLLSLVDDADNKKEYVKAAFKSPRVINSHSISFLSPGTLDFRILHRFGPVDQGLNTLFGLDQASMRIGFDYGLGRNLMLGFGRSTFKKELDGFIKFAPVMQSTGKGQMPVTIALVAGMTVNTLPWQDTSIKNNFSSRLQYYFQAIIGRKFSESFSLQLMPTMVHENIVPLQTQSNDLYALGAGARLKVSNRIALTCDYYYRLTAEANNPNHNPLSLGVDIETGGHVFQLHFSNATGMNEPTLITETTGSWGKGEIRFGFNLSRVFQVKKHKAST